MADSAPKPYSIDPTLYLYTSLTSGSSHIITATSRLETILKANRIPFKAIDLATDEKARMLWGRRSGKDETGRVRKMPGLVQMGLVVGDLVEIEEWNEYGELKQHVTIVKDPNAAPVKSVMPAPSKAPVVLQENKKPESASASTPLTKSVEAEKKPAVSEQSAMSLALRQVGEQAAQKAKDIKKKGPVETFSGVGNAEPSKEKETTEPAKEKEKTVSKPEPISVQDTSAEPATPSRAIHSSLQSPNSTAWRPIDVNPPILVHRGSSVSQASAEEIKKIEDEAAIQEEDEEDEESESDSSSEEEAPKKLIPAVGAAKLAAKPKDDESSDSDSESESDEEEAQSKAPAKPAAKPKPKEDESDSTSESSESSDDEGKAAKPPIKPIVKPVEKPKVATKQEVVDESSEESESSEEDSEEEVPAKKPVKT